MNYMENASFFYNDDLICQMEQSLTLLGSPLSQNVEFQRPEDEREGSKKRSQLFETDQEEVATPNYPEKPLKKPYSVSLPYQHHPELLNLCVGMSQRRAPKFDDNLLQHWGFIMAGVAQYVTDPANRLAFLIDECEGKPRGAIEHCIKLEIRVLDVKYEKRLTESDAKGDNRTVDDDGNVRRRITLRKAAWLIKLIEESVISILTYCFLLDLDVLQRSRLLSRVWVLFVAFYRLFVKCL
ncbi:hypothetical protein CLF_106610 [Clonorchis sinensis]|uniref:Uncharacterized protein n=1 Tax=Clonorchis sinensis TaxID=79923 RepID=G7YFE4_CLOSI|nr:hypothetical protein CLF_106610 [Clonorchis sinensis]